ncbi:hypothetical protein GCM10025786_27620 [Nocardioides caeni]
MRAGAELGGHLSTWRKLQAGDLGVSVGAYLNVLRALGQLERAIDATDPYETDLGRARADEILPQRVRGPSR